MGQKVEVLFRVNIPVFEVPEGKKVAFGIMFVRFSIQVR